MYRQRAQEKCTLEQYLLQVERLPATLYFDMLSALRFYTDPASCSPSLTEGACDIMKRSSPDALAQQLTPPKWKVRTAPNQDIPEDASALPEVQVLIQQNNMETKVKKRLKTFDFLNMAFCTIGGEAVKNRNKCTVVMKLLEEFIDRYSTLPRNTSLAKVLYAWGDAEMIPEAAQLVKALVQSKGKVSHAFTNSFEERVATVTLRVLVKSADTSRELVMDVLRLLPPPAYKRRLFFPLLEYARENKDTPFVLRILSVASDNDVELWDTDYHEILATIDRSHPEASQVCRDATEQVLVSMAEHHPVVGTNNARLVERLLGGSHVTISSSGLCSSCGCTLRSFDFTEADRKILVQDIFDKLMIPRVEGKSHYEPDKKVNEAEKAKRLSEVEKFKEAVAKAQYDAVIDGANVGYYGLTSWYCEAKEVLLRERGIDPATEPLSVRTQIPVPVDVPPKFSLIEDMRTTIVRSGRNPLIVLHCRHLVGGPEGNMELVKRWQAAGCIVPSPSFLNDDYCWLYAAIIRPNTFVISNDQMRDHHFSLLSSRSFLRWRQRHRITYRALFHAATRTVTLATHTPRPFAVWVQAATPTGAAARHWHVPYLAGIPVIDQATNRTTTRDGDVDLCKDGDDTCSGWLCTWKA